MLRTAMYPGESLSAALRRLVRRAYAESAEASTDRLSILEHRMGEIQRDLAEIKGAVADLAGVLGRIERLGTAAPSPSGEQVRPEDVGMDWALRMADDLGKEE